MQRVCRLQRLAGARPSAAPRLSFSTTTARPSAGAAGKATAAEVKRIGVIGAGQMGLGIALVAAQRAGVPVTLVDASQAALDKGLAFADKLLAKDVAKQRLSAAEAEAARGRLSGTTDMAALGADGGVDLVIEAVPEIPELKFELFRRLAATAAAHTVLATNTSSISITKIAAAAASQAGPLSGPEAQAVASRVVATHFMNPVPVQKGVEIISGLQTSAATLATAVAFCERMGKVASTSADAPGFLANRILMPYINEAVICLETGVGDRDSIDAIMKNGTGVPMGPLTLADFIGLDTCLAIMQVLHRETGDSKYRPSVLLGKMVDAGWLGKKTGKGFYEY